MLNIDCGSIRFQYQSSLYQIPVQILLHFTHPFQSPTTFVAVRFDQRYWTKVKVN